jgi:hypothetical protein
MINIYWGNFDIFHHEHRWLCLRYEREVPLPKKIKYEGETFCWEYWVRNCIPLIRDEDSFNYQEVKKQFLIELQQKVKWKLDDIRILRKEIDETNILINKYL